MRTCYTCRKDKDDSEFARTTNNKCRSCTSEYMREYRKKHPEKFETSPEYDVWRDMRKRCRSDPHYVSRGITVCERWDSSFSDFFSDMGPRPDGVGKGGRALYSIEREDNDGNYEPGNCKWATDLEQSRNRTNTTKVEVNGESTTMSEVMEKTGLNYSTLRSRLARGSFGGNINSPIRTAKFEFEGEVLTSRQIVERTGKCRATVKRMASDGRLKKVEN